MSNKARSAKAESGGDKPPQSVWRNPVVVAAIAAAVIGGIFGVIELTMKIYGERELGKVPPIEQPVTATNEQVRPERFDIPTSPLADLMKVAHKALRNAPGVVDLQTRLDAIAVLRSVSSTEVPADFYAQANGLLVAYLKHAVEERRGVDDDFADPYPRDTRVTRPRTIVAALETLKTLQRSAPEPLEISISGIDFSFMNLSLLDLSGFTATHTNFRNAFLSGCICRGVNFNNASFRDAVIWTEKQADFTGSSFINTDITGSKWANVNLNGSNIEKALGRPLKWADIVPVEKRRLFPDLR